MPCKGQINEWLPDLSEDESVVDGEAGEGDEVLEHQVHPGDVDLNHNYLEGWFTNFSRFLGR